MTKYILITALLIIFTSCTKPNLSSLGEWEIIEYYGDPGDGSGTFQPVDSDKSLSFFDDGTLEIKNGSLCDLGAESGDFTVNYDEESKTISANCSSTSNIIHRYEIDSEDNLLIYYPCIEPCVEKYEKK